MDRVTELRLLDEMLRLKREKTSFLDRAPSTSKIERYLDVERFELEQQHIFRVLPQMGAHSSELPNNGSFLRRTLSGIPLLFVRGSDGVARAFINVCRHRGAQLVREDSGCQKHFSCPYHGWSWSDQGDLTAVPHEDQGFPGLDKASLGLKQIECVEKYGWIWARIKANPHHPMDIDDFLDGLESDFKWFKGEDLVTFKVDQRVWNANWKLLMEGGLETYHFRVAHKNSLGPYFNDNLSTYQMFGAHTRSMLPRATISDLPNQDRSEWVFRDHVNALYLIFPISTLLVQQDHLIWFQATPLAVDKTFIQLMTLRPKTDKPLSEEETEYWLRNHRITRFTLNEDFGIGEEIQANMSSGANTHFQFGRFEGALTKANDMVERMIGWDNR